MLGAGRVKKPTHNQKLISEYSENSSTFVTILLWPLPVISGKEQEIAIQGVAVSTLSDHNIIHFYFYSHLLRGLLLFAFAQMFY